MKYGAVDLRYRSFVNAKLKTLTDPAVLMATNRSSGLKTTGSRPPVKDCDALKLLFTTSCTESVSVCAPARRRNAAHASTGHKEFL